MKPSRLIRAARHGIALCTGIALICSTLHSARADDPTASIERIDPLEIDEALASFRVLDGFEMQLVAAEPQVVDPVDLVYDEDGRMYVVEMRDYPYPTAEGETPQGRVRLLEDLDGDGRYETSHVFADQLPWPTSIARYRGGVFVAAAPDIWYLEDTDGDHRADRRERIYTGFGTYNVQAIVNNLKWGIDHAIYVAASGNGGEVRPVDEEVDPVVLRRRDFRFDPATQSFEAISGGARFGNSFDDYYRRFICNIRNPAQHVVLPARYLARNPHLAVPEVVTDVAAAGDQIPVFRISPVEPWREVRARRWTAAGERYPRSELFGAGFVTSSSGVTIYRGNAYEPAYRGNIFVGEVAGNLVHRQRVEPAGVTFASVRADDGAEFVASTDIWFRPVNLVHSPDGTLHVLDMYRETIEHPWSIPDDIKAQLDLERGNDRGRIYRLAPPEFELPPPPRLSQATGAQLVAHLAHPNAWWRETAARLIHQRQDRSAIEPLRQLCRESSSPLGRLHALWSLEGLDALGDDELLAALSDPDAGVREHAVRLAERRLRPGSALMHAVLDSAQDDSSRVRFQAAFTLGELPWEDAQPGLLAIARRDAADRWIRTAVLSSLGQHANRFLIALFDDPEFTRSEAGRPLVRELAQLVAAPGEVATISVVLGHLGTGREQLEPRVVDTIVLGLAEGVGRRGEHLSQVAERLSPSERSILTTAFERASLAARDGAAELPDRQVAIEVLATGVLADAAPLLVELIDSRQPDVVQRAAVRALGTYADLAVAERLIEGWASYTPGVRDLVTETLLTRKPWTLAMLDHFAGDSAAAATLAIAQRQLLLAHRDAEIRQRAEALLANARPGAREDIIAQYRMALQEPGDVERGAVVFRRECATCHRLGDKGHEVGPSLATVRNRTPEELLSHILDPNRELAPNFVNYVTELRDGRVLTGIIAAETAGSITLRRGDAAEDVILRGQIDRLASTGVSLMPEGLEQRVTPAEMIDLIAFLLHTE